MRPRRSAAALAQKNPSHWFQPDDRPWVERRSWTEEPNYESAPLERRAIADQFHRDGAVVLPKVIEEERCAEIRGLIEPHLEADGNRRLTNAAWAIPAVRALAVEPMIVDTIEFLYGRRPIPFQTLNFRQGTEQAAHRDDGHFDSLPPSFMCGAWVALESIGSDQGPVRYRPGSQRSADTTEGDERAEAIAEVDFVADPGDVLIWAAGLAHGGAAVRDGSSSRWSQVTHYVFEDCTWYTPMHSDVAENQLRLRLPLRDLGTGRVVRPSLLGEPARFVHGRAGRSRVLHPTERAAVTERAASFGRSLGPRLRSAVRFEVARRTGRPPR